MKQIPSDLKARYSSMLVQKGVPEKDHYYYGKWFRYYLDFCEKYRFNQLNKETLVHFIKFEGQEINGSTAKIGNSFNIIIL